MLSLYASQTITIPDGPIKLQYTIFKDDEDKNVFYVLPENPNFIMDNGKPRFRFIKYRGAAPDAGKGGFCVFSVALDLSNLTENAQVRAKAVQKLLDKNSPIVKAMQQRAEDTLEMCVATADNKDQTQYEALRKKLGYSPKQAEALVKEYQDGKKVTAKDFEVLPDSSNIEFRPVTFTASTAALNLKQMQGGLVEDVINPASPSLLGDHSTVFTVELTQQGATLFEQVMKAGQAGVVAVNYSPKFEARLPPATVTVTYKNENSSKFTRDVSRDTWGNKDKIAKTREDFLKENAKVDVDMGSIVGMGQDEVTALRKRLEDWGNDQLQDILNSKLTIDTTDLTEGADKVDHFSNELKAVNDFTRVWSESTSIIYSPGTLSMQLPTIESIVGSDPKVLEQYFQEINTLDVFFEDEEIQVAVNTDWDHLGIFSVEVKLYYGPDMAAIKRDVESGKITKGADGVLQNFDPTRYNLSLKEIPFNKSQPPMSDKQTWPKEKDGNGNGINTYVYTYQINYNGSTIHYESPCYYTDDPVLTLSVVDEVLQVEANGRNLVNWDIVQSVRFDIDYEDTANNIHQRYFYQLNESDPIEFQPKPIGAKRTQNVNYKSTFYLKDGRQITVPQTGSTAVNQTGKITIPVDDPFSGMNTYNFLPKMGNIVDFIGITANYAVPALNFQMTQDLTFTDDTTKTWEVPVVLDASGASEGHLTYSGKMREQGQMKDISGDDGGDNFIEVGPDNILTVQFSPMRIDFNKYLAVSLYVKYKDQEESYDFASTTDPLFTFNAVVDNRSDKCQYRLELIDSNSGDTIYVPGASATDWTETNKSRVLLFLDIKRSGN